jgi:hypothetical protein
MRLQNDMPDWSFHTSWWGLIRRRLVTYSPPTDPNVTTCAGLGRNGGKSMVALGIEH